MPRYAETTKLLDRDLATVSPEAAVKNIEMWEESLGEMDSKEAKAVVKDLDALKKALSSKTPNGATIGKLMARLGSQTTKLAEDASDASSEKLRAIGEALSSAGSGEDSDDAEDDDADAKPKTASKAAKG